jgi:hypothetical protein
MRAQEIVLAGPSGTIRPSKHEPFRRLRLEARQVAVVVATLPHEPAVAGGDVTGAFPIRKERLRSTCGLEVAWARRRADASNVYYGRLVVPAGGRHRDGRQQETTVARPPGAASRTNEIATRLWRRTHHRRLARPPSRCRRPVSDVGAADLIRAIPGDSLRTGECVLRRDDVSARCSACPASSQQRPLTSCVRSAPMLSGPLRSRGTAVLQVSLTHPKCRVRSPAVRVRACLSQGTKVNCALPDVLPLIEGSPAPKAGAGEWPLGLVRR